MIERHVLPGLGHVEVASVDTRTLERFRTGLKIKSPVYRNNVMRVVRKLLHLAGTRPTMPRPLREVPLRLEFSDTERKALLAAIEPRLHGLFTLAFETGLSKSDLLYLRWSDIRLKEGLIIRERQKTGVAARIPISSAARFALLAARSRSGLVFTTAQGRPFAESVVNRAFKSAKIKAKITRRARFHDIRHSFGSRLASAGVPLLVIRDCMGHSDSRTTLRYARVDRVALEQARKALEK
jgi:integrase